MASDTASRPSTTTQDPPESTREIYHRVKNHLQTALSLLDLQGARATHADTQRELRRARERLHSLALMYEQLVVGTDPTHVDLRAYLSALARYYLGNTTAVVQVDASGTVDAGRAATLGLVVGELLSNCKEHAELRKPDACVRVRCEPHDTALSLRVADNGPGLPPGVDLRQPSTFGLTLVQALANQLGASVRGDSGPSGLSVEIALRERG